MQLALQLFPQFAAALLALRTALQAVAACVPRMGCGHAGVARGQASDDEGGGVSVLHEVLLGVDGVDGRPGRWKGLAR